jgi:hypothetical protein
LRKVVLGERGQSRCLGGLPGLGVQQFGNRGLGLILGDNVWNRSAGVARGRGVIEIGNPTGGDGDIGNGTRGYSRRSRVGKRVIDLIGGSRLFAR